MHWITWTLVVIVIVGSSGCGKPSDDPAATPMAENGGSPPAPTGPWQEAARDALSKGSAFLISARADLGWEFKPGAGPDVGITALALDALFRTPGVDKARFAKDLDWVVSHQQDDGAIFEPKQGLATYVTSAAVMALVASKDPKYRPVIDKAAQFIAKVQSDEGEGLTESSEDYGGVGYGGSGVINMSTTQMAVEAASAAGLPKDHAFYTKALRFLERSQNRSESNDTTHQVEGVTVVPGNDGGGIYRPGESKAGREKLGDGRVTFRSYGSMTYALLKSYLLCDLDARDERVKAALAWMGSNFEVDHNPGMEHTDEPQARYQGLYYYYLTLGRCLQAAERQRVELPEALQSWRKALAEALVRRQAENGSWANHQDRWFEGLPALATAYAIIALQEALETP
jgi:squalene-hopene/tetraprenyl-beta-curcumene cyclase